MGGQKIVFRHIRFILIEGHFMETINICKNVIFLCLGIPHTFFKIIIRVINIFKQRMRGIICKKCCMGKMKGQQRNKIIYPHVSLGFFYHLSLKLVFPFQALALIIDSALKREASKISIKVMKIKQNRQQLDEYWYDYSCISIDFDGRSLSKLEFEEMSQNYSTDKDFNSFIYDIKLGTLSLGKVVLFINCDERQKKVSLISVDDRINPQYSKKPFGYSYIEEIQTGNIKGQSNKYNKERIVQALKIFPSNIEKLLDCEKERFKILILEPKIIITSSKGLYLMLSESSYGQDLNVYINHLKIQFLDSIGYSIQKHAEISFSKFYTLLYRQMKIQLMIGEKQQHIQGVSYEQQLKQLQEKNKIIKLPVKQIQGVKEMRLYQAGSEYLKHNNGVLIYYQGRMINRLQNQFGKMFEECFYKKKYKPNPENVWEIIGIIQLDISPNILKNGFPNSGLYRNFFRELQDFLKKYFCDINSKKSRENENEELKLIEKQNQEKIEKKGEEIFEQKKDNE